MFTERGGRWYRPGEHLPAFWRADRRRIGGRSAGPDHAAQADAAQRPEGNAARIALRVRLVRDERRVVPPGQPRSDAGSRASPPGPSVRRRPSSRHCTGPGPADRAARQRKPRCWCSATPGALPLVPERRAVLGSRCLDSAGLPGRPRPRRAGASRAVRAGAGRSGRSRSGRVRADRARRLPAAQPRRHPAGLGRPAGSRAGEGSPA